MNGATQTEIARLQLLASTVALEAAQLEFANQRPFTLAFNAVRDLELAARVNAFVARFGRLRTR